LSATGTVTFDGVSFADGAAANTLVTTSGGAVGIGTASPAVNLEVRGSGQILRVSDGTTGASIYSASGLFGFNNQTGEDGMFGSTASHYLYFATNGSERMRIDSSGNLLVGMSSAPSGIASDPVGVCIFGPSATGATVLTRNSANSVLYVNNKTSGGDLVIFYNGGNSVGSITSNGTITAFNTTSDYRLKDITGPLIDSGTFIDALKPKVGTWKADGSKFVGFIAHEFAEVSPTSVTGKKDAVDADGNPKYQGMQASSAEVIANLVAELQSVRARLAALESK